MTYARIVDLERSLDAVLPERQFTGPPPPELIDRARRWSEAVWQAAVDEGPIEPDLQTRTRGLAIVARPIFICGVHRSGTTLVRDLLDGHPALAVLPSEGTWFTNFEAHIARWGAGARAHFITEWIRRLANPINQPPYWSIGRSTPSDSPSVRFARAAHAWWTALETGLGPVVSSSPLAAVALAYAQTRAGGELPAALSSWVEKTPTNEQHVARLWREYPEARVIHVLRDPVAVFASRKRAEERATGAFRTAPAVLHDLKASYAVARDHASTTSSDRYLVVRYEDIVTDAQGTLARLAGALGIEPLPVLFHPTVAGQPSASNSSFGSAAGAGKISATAPPGNVLTTEEREVVGAIVGPNAVQFGYHLPAPGPWRAHYLKLKLRWNRGSQATV